MAVTALELEALKQDAEIKRTIARDAHEAAAAAEKSYRDALNEASGLVGHVLEYSRSTGYGRHQRTSKMRMRVSRVTPHYETELYAHGSAVIANGNIGIMKREARVSDCTDLGPYEEWKAARK